MGNYSHYLLICFSLGITKAIKTTRKLHGLRLGYSCEMAVGQELEYLVRPETSAYRVFHDILFDNFNIDHLVISPNGVFVIETKGRSKPVTDAGKQYRVIVKDNALHFPHHVETEPLEQTRRNVKSVRQWLTEATGFQVEVAGVLVLPGWYIELKQRSVDPYIMNAAGLPKVLPKLRAGNGLLELGQVQAIAYQVEQKVRDVKRDSKTQVK